MLESGVSLILQQCKPDFASHLHEANHTLLRGNGTISDRVLNTRRDNVTISGPNSRRRFAPEREGALRLNRMHKIEHLWVGNSRD